MKTLKHRVAVITGAASGIGTALAWAAAARGMKVVLADLQQEPMLDLLHQLQATGSTAIAKVCDVRDFAQMQCLSQACIDEFGSVHLLFNNAGVGHGSLLWEHSAEDFDWMMAVNVSGVFNGIRCFTPLMLSLSGSEESYEGHIVNTASLAGWVNGPLMGLYNASKHAVTALTESLYQDLQLVDSQIGVSLLCPSFVPTQIARPGRYRDHPTSAQVQTESQKLAARLHRRAVATGSVTAQEVARLTFEAIASDQFYIWPGDDVQAEISDRTRSLLSNENPVPAAARHPREFLPIKQRLAMSPRSSTTLQK